LSRWVRWRSYRGTPPTTATTAGRTTPYVEAASQDRLISFHDERRMCMGRFGAAALGRAAAGPVAAGACAR
jgi:hypothetical protein